MRTLFKTLVVGAFLAIPVLTAAPERADAFQRRDRVGRDRDDDRDWSARRGHNRYWSGYWNWYDRTYRPYYYRRYHYDRDRDYSFRYSPYYYGYRPYYGSGYYYRPYNSVQIGPLEFGWR